MAVVEAAADIVGGGVDAVGQRCSTSTMLVSTCCIDIRVGGTNPGTWWPFQSLGPPRAGPFFLSLLVVLLMARAAVFIDVVGMGAASGSCCGR